MGDNRTDLRMRLLSVAVWIHIAVAAGDENGIQPTHQFFRVDLFWNQWQQHRSSARMKQRLAVMFAQIELILPSIDATGNAN